MRRKLQIMLLAGGVTVWCQTQLTIYNQNFAVVKERRVLNLKSGSNEVRVTDITAHLEPDSVVLRDVQQPDAIRILEQNYEGDPLSEGLLLQKYEGKVIEFEVTTPQTGEKADRAGADLEERLCSPFGGDAIVWSAICDFPDGVLEPAERWRTADRRS